MPPIHHCALLGELDGLRLLVAHGADPDQCIKGGRSVLYTALSFGQLGLAQAVLELADDGTRRFLATHGDEDDVTPLHGLVSAKNLPEITPEVEAMIRALLDAGADVHAVARIPDGAKTATVVELAEGHPQRDRLLPLLRRA